MISMQRSDVNAVKRKPHLTEWIPLLLVSVVFIVLSGCGTGMDTATSLQVNGQERVSTIKGTQTGGGLTGAATPKNEILSRKERDLVILFKGLLLMDHQPGLLISEIQAAEMLPMVSQSAEDGGMEPENETKIRALLTVEQKNYLDDKTSRLKQFTDEFNIEQQMIDLLKSKIIP
jgi:hypothetical protein